jgi:GTP cyclohydrolase II
MSLSPSPLERLNRARADLRMGLPVVLTSGSEGALVVSAEVLTTERLDDLRRIGTPVVALTARRAETLKARAYDGDLARVALPADAGVAWIEALADPADDLTHPMKGPLISVRDGNASLHRAAIRLVKSAQLLPSAVVVALPMAMEFAQEHSLTTLSADHHRIIPAILVFAHWLFMIRIILVVPSQWTISVIRKRHIQAFFGVNVLLKYKNSS